MGEPILFYVIVFEGNEDEKKDEQCMKIGCFIRRKLESTNSNTTDWRFFTESMYLQEHYALERLCAPCWNKSTGLELKL
jgi:hypothetical protein